MPPVYPQIPSDWLEVVDDESPCVASFEADSSRAIMVYDIPFLQLAYGTGTAIGTILGYSYVDSDKFLRRVLPLPHPYFQNLWASRITNVQLRGPGLRDGNGNLASKANSNFMTPGIGGSNFALYDTARMTILYEARDYLVLDDGSLQLQYDGDESYRFVSTVLHPAAKFLTNERGGFNWAESNAGGPPVDSAVTAAISKLDLTVDVTMIWHQVPAYYVFNTTGNPPVYTNPSNNVLDVVGCINNADWHGYPAGTLLCLPPVFTPHTYPVGPGGLGLLPPFTIPLYWDVQFNFKYYNPQLGLGADATITGHNTVPWLPSNLNYGIRSKAPSPPAAPRLLYQTAGFDTLFE